MVVDGQLDKHEAPANAAAIRCDHGGRLRRKRRSRHWSPCTPRETGRASAGVALKHPCVVLQRGARASHTR